MDAITLSLDRLVEESRVEPTQGWRLILVASLANLVFKAGIAAALGGWQFGLRLGTVFGIGALGGLAILFFWPAAWSFQIPDETPHAAQAAQVRVAPGLGQR